jgi:DNA-directed RNA polymerase specialized sigma24 family protein
MAFAPAAGREMRYDRVGRAAFALARRICGDGALAADVVERAFASPAALPEGAAGDGLLLRRVRELACDSRGRRPGELVAVSTPPPALASLSAVHWHVLDLVALQGEGVREAAVRLRLPEDTVLTLLHEALRTTGALLSGAGQPDGHADSARVALLR